MLTANSSNYCWELWIHMLSFRNIFEIRSPSRMVFGVNISFNIAQWLKLEHLHLLFGYAFNIHLRKIRFEYHLLNCRIGLSFRIIPFYMDVWISVKLIIVMFLQNFRYLFFREYQLCFSVVFQIRTNMIIVLNISCSERNEMKERTSGK